MGFKRANYYLPKILAMSDSWVSTSFFWIKSMIERVPYDIKKNLQKASLLHERAVSDYALCMEFNKSMSDILTMFENIRCFNIADKMRLFLLVCNPKLDVYCDKSTVVAQLTKTFNHFRIPLKN